MVKYYGRAKTRVGSVNTTQLGLKMSGCPSKVGLSGQNNRYIQQRVSCMRGICGIPLVNGAIWRHTLRNKHPFCAEPSHKCLAAAGGIGNINTPYYKTLQAGKEGCGYGHPASGDKHRAFPDGLKLTAGSAAASGGGGKVFVTGYQTRTIEGKPSKFGSLQPNTIPGGDGVKVFSLFSCCTPAQGAAPAVALGLFLPGHPLPHDAPFPFSGLIIRNSKGEIEVSYGQGDLVQPAFGTTDYNFVAHGKPFGFKSGSTYTIQFLL